MTQRLYYDDCYLRDFHARVIDSADGGRRVYLDRTAFYPTSGGQPFDLGTIGGAAVREVVDEEERIAHVLESPVTGDVEARIDWDRRYDHMQQHTGQHLLSAVLIEQFDITTVSFHMGAVTSTIDVDTADLSMARIERAEERCAEIAGEARPVSISYEDSSARRSGLAESVGAGRRPCGSCRSTVWTAARAAERTCARRRRSGRC